MRWGALVVGLACLASADELGWSPEVRVLAKAENLDGIEFPAGTKITQSGGPGAHLLLGAELIGALTIHGVSFPARSVIHFQPIAKLDEATLGAPATIQGVRCLTLVRFHPNGKLYAGDLAHPASVQGVPLPERTWVWLDPEGRLSGADLPSPTRIQGILVAATPRLGFHPNGKLASAALGEPMTVHAIPIPAGAELQFHESGNLRAAGFAGNLIEFTEDGLPFTARLAQALTIGALHFPAETSIEFRRGAPWDVGFVQPGELQSVAIPQGTRVSLREDGTIDWLDFSLSKKPILIQSILCDKGGLVRLWPGGKIQQITLGAATEIQENSLPPKTVVNFLENGKLDYADIHWVDKEPTIQSVVCDKLAMIHFHQNGRLKQCELARPAIVEGKKYPVSTFLDFDERGKLVSAR